MKNYQNDFMQQGGSAAKISLQLQLGPIQPDLFPVNLEEFAILKNPYDLDAHSFSENKKDLQTPSAKNTPLQRFQDPQILDTFQIELQEQFVGAHHDHKLNYQTLDIIPTAQKNSQAQLLQQQSSENSFKKLDFINEFQGIQQEQPDQEQRVYPKSFYQGYGIFSKVCFIHIFQYMLLIRAQILNKGLKLRIEHLPVLSDQERIEPNFIRASMSYQQTCQKNKMFTKWDMIKLIFFGVLKTKTMLILLFNLIDCAGKNIVSILMSLLIKSIYVNDIKWAYIYGTIISLVNIISLLGRHNAYYFGYQFSIQARMILINMVYQKLTELNSYSIKEANVGKIINMVSGDLNSLEFYLVMVFQLLVMPVSLAFGCGILWVRFDGPIGLVAIAVMITVYPMQIMYQKISSKYTIEAKKYGDNRLKLQNELIEGIRLIKMYAWEQAFDQLIKTVRQKEFTCYTKIWLINTLDRGINQLCHMWASLIFFAIIYYGEYVPLTSANMIPTIQLVIYLKVTCIFLVSYALQSWINIGISFQRMVDILTLENFEMKQLEPYEEDQKVDDQGDSSLGIPVLSFKNFSCYWTANVTKQIQPALKNINLDIYPGQLVAIVGRIGSGKSTLLNSVIMEVPSYKGQYKIFGESGANQLNKIQVGYVEQEPFIFPDTIKKNILFGRPYNSQLYNLVVQVSSMTDDLNLMQSGDMTEIGERGINLSGGQKARVSLARALYQMADVYIFDDPLSAVDAKVARSIFDSAIKDFIFKVQPKLSGSLVQPVVLLATHQIQFAIECDYMVVLDVGTMVAKGRYNEIKNNLNMISKDFAVVEKKDISQKTQKSLLKNVKQTEYDYSPSNKTNTDKEKITLYKREENSQQNVTLQSYKRYFNRWSPPFLIFIVIIQCFAYEIIYNFFLRYVSLFDSYNRQEMLTAFVFLGILCAIGYVNNMIKYVTNLSGVLGANRSLHNNMLEQLCFSPVEFFDTNPSGRILNRFSTDLSLADTQVNNMLWDIQELMSFFLVALVTLLILQPWFIFAMVLTILSNIYILRFSKSIIGQAKECDLIQRSPLFDLFKKTLSGVIQVRLYKQQIWFQKNFFELSNKCIQSNLAFFYTQRSFGFNIDFVGQLASTFGIFLIITLNQSNTAVFVQALLLLLTFNDSQQWCLRQMISFDATMNCFNRMFQIIDLVPEAPHHMQIDQQMKNSWPSKGEVKFTNVFLRYREDTDLVLKGMSFSIKSGDKVGCVGRTGAGKSSILQALFRMVEIQPNVGGQISIDGQDISKLGLALLRSSIAIIPQTPFVFSGTIKRNLDPLEQYTDEALWQVLQETNLIGLVKKMSHQLDTDMTDVNSVFSVGEKQLICLARTILSNKKIIVLDEATANVDMKTDEFIQEKIREKFSDCTIITIAHRLNTIADYDKVMVIESGIVAEYGPPLELLSTNLIKPVIDRDTLFAELVRQTGPENSALILELAKNHYQRSIKVV